MFDFFGLGKLFKIFIETFVPPAYVVSTAMTKEGVDGRIVAFSDRGSYVAEQYRVLRTNIYSLSPDKPLKTLVITSSHGKEGKSVTSANLAYSLSLDEEKKVLLVDGDFRKPTIHKLFSLNRKPGFVNVLRGEADLEPFLTKPVVGNLYILPAGSVGQNFSGILNHNKLKEFINSLKPRFDFIVFDTAPVLNATDSSILGSLCDAVLLVVKAEETQKAIAEETFIMLKNAQAKPKACILTHFTAAPYYGYSYSYKYEYSNRPNKLK